MHLLASRLCLLRVFRQMHGCNTASVTKQPSMQASLTAFWTTFQPPICELMYCTMYDVSRTEKSMSQICRARLHPQTSIRKYMFFYRFGSSSLCFSRPVIEFLIVALTPLSFSRHAAVRSILRLLRLYGSYISSGFCQSRSCTSTNSFTGKSCNDIVKLED